MSEWKNVTAENFCDSVRDGTHDTPKQVEKGYKLVTAKHIYNGQIDLSDAYLISEKDYKKINERSKVEKWDVLMSMIGNGLGKSAVVKDTPQYAIKNLALFKLGNEIKAKWLHYYLSSKMGQGYIYNSLQGSGQPFISLGILRKFPIPIPTDTNLMFKVVEILSRYDSLIENYQKQIKLLEESAQRLYKEWFIDLRFPEHENTKIVDGVPEGWEKKKIKDLVDLKSGYAFKSSAFVEKGKYKIVTIKNVKDGVFDGDNVSYLNSVPEKMPSHCILQTGDILLSLTGNVGRICMVVGDNYLLNQRVAKLESKFPVFTYCLFRHYDTFVAINNLANGAAQQNVSPIRIGEMDMLVANDKIMH
ncbi:MAG: restriction endonuclease subunit S, partial [Bacteroidaceae bacterium]|nr:restriction endonuclease subunit S [Bacteroidaceae bacterium]